MIHFLKGQCHEIFASGFFHESVSPLPQSIPLGPFRIFEIFAIQGAPPVSTTPEANLQMSICFNVFTYLANYNSDGVWTSSTQDVIVAMSSLHTGLQSLPRPTSSFTVFLLAFFHVSCLMSHFSREKVYLLHFLTSMPPKARRFSFL